MAPLYFRGAHAAIICYQINSRDTFEAVKMWVEELNSKTEGNTLIVLVGTKVDLETERVISATEGAAYASSISALFFEVSAKTGQGVENLFGLLSDALVLRSARTPVTPSTSQKLTPPWRKSHHQKHC
ncbi:small GTP-binding protein [Pelomyxa schiedti]|nr:small GTP-binding protein [Pelomyxa schiedti]